VVVCHSDLDLASGCRVHCRRAHSVVLTVVRWVRRMHRGRL